MSSQGWFRVRKRLPPSFRVMTMKKIGILFAAFLALGLWVYFYEIEGEKTRQAAKEREESLLRLEQDQISSVRMERPGQDPVLLEKIGEGWALKAPLEAPADKTSVDSLVRDLGTARIDRTFEEVGTGAEEYGFAEPRLKLTVGAGDESRVLSVGNDDFTGSKVYVQVEGESQVHVVSDRLFTAADKTLMDWRDKKVVSMERDKIAAIEILRASEKLRLKQEDGQWMLESPVREAADQSAVTGLLSSLEFAEAKQYVSEESDDLRRYGLEKPQLSVRFQEEDREDWETLDLGNEFEEAEDQYLARNPARSPVFSIGKEVRDKLAQDLWEFRDKDVIDVDQDEIAAVVVKIGDLEVHARREDYKWILETPEEQKGQEALAYKFWYPMDDIKFESIDDATAKAGTDLPQAQVRVRIELKDGSIRNFQFARQGKRYVARKMESGRTGAISKEAFEKIQFKVDDIV